MANDFPPTDVIIDKQNQSSVAVLADAEVDGARYLLVRMPKLERQGSPKHALSPRSTRNSGDGPERRTPPSISAIFDAFLLPKVIAT